MKADPKAAEGAAPNAKKKLLIMILLGVLVAGLGAGGAWFFTRPSGDEDAKPSKSAKKKEAVKPEFLALDPFTVNLQPENGEQYLQVQFTLQVDSLEQAEIIKTNMARVRSRVLMLLSAKKASELTSTEGKQKLAAEIIAAVKDPFEPKGDEQEVSDVLFTSFIIQ
jgi:flagellar FliL protein